jgi:hypothetical protein
MIQLFFLSIDGKLLTQPEQYETSFFFQKLLQEQKNYELRLTPLSEEEVRNLQELSLVILPVLMGTQTASTLTGNPYYFLPTFWQGELVTLEQQGEELFLHYVALLTTEKSGEGTE